jgi:prepilin-type N-terminal cleavage/methylation domain-containing protein
VTTPSPAPRNAGFTLIELMIVIMVIAILAAISLPIVLTARVTSQQTAARAMIARVVTACEQYSIKESRFTKIGDLARLKLVEIAPSDPSEGVGINDYLSSYSYLCDADDPGDVAENGAYYFCVVPGPGVTDTDVWTTYEVFAFPRDYQGPSVPYKGAHQGFVFRAALGATRGMDLTTDPITELPVE